MRILFSSLPSHGHTFPLVPLAEACLAAGHRVRWATAGEFLPVIAPFGFELAPAGLSMRQAFTDPRLPTLSGRPEPAELQSRGLRVFGEILGPAFARDLGPVIEEYAPELVVAEVVNGGAGVATLAAGVPLIWHGFGRLTGRVGPMLHDNLVARLASRGRPVPAEQVAAIPVIDVCPPSLADPGFAGVAPTVPLRPTAVRVPGEPPPPEFRAGRPLIYLTLGTAFGSSEVLRTAMDGLGGLDLDVLVATGPMVDPDALAGAPANVRVEAWVPQGAVLERADAVVHHGGSGTTLGAAAAGLPQLFLPQGADQFSNAAMICDVGAGRQLAPADVTPDAVRDEVVALLDDQDVRARCRSLAREIAAMPAPVDVVERLVDWQRVAAGAG